MRVLVMCECSGVVREAFRALGHDAWSNDFKAAEDGSPHHIQGDALKVVRDFRPDLGIAHPVCRFLANSGAKHLYAGMKKENGPAPERWESMREAAAFFRALWEATDSPKCFENPIMHEAGRAALGFGPSQIVQPWMFGHLESKATGLYLDRPPPLRSTANVFREMMRLPENQRNRIHYMPPGPERETERSRSYPGMWAAAAQQWGAGRHSLF